MNHRIYHMHSFSRSGETLLLRCLNAHPNIHVVHQINAEDKPEDIALHNFLKDYKEKVIPHEHPLVEEASVKNEDVILLKNAAWANSYEHNGFILARNPFAVANSFKMVDENERRHKRRKRQYRRWAKGIDKNLVPFVNDEEDSFVNFSVLYAAKMGDAVELNQEIIYYEDFVINPEASLRKICSVLQVEWDSSVLKSHELYSEGEYGHGGIPLWKDIHSGSLHSYKKLPQADIYKIYGVTRSVIKKLGYKFDGDACYVNR